MADYVAMATNHPSKGLALWIRQGNITKVVSYSGKYTKTPEYHAEISQSDLDDIVSQYRTSYPDLIIGLQTPTGIL